MSSGLKLYYNRANLEQGVPPLRVPLIKGVCRFQDVDGLHKRGLLVVERWPEMTVWDFWTLEEIEKLLKQRRDPRYPVYARAYRILDYAFKHVTNWGPVQSDARRARVVDMNYREAGAFPLKVVKARVPAP